MFKIADFLQQLGKPNGKPENAQKLKGAIAELEVERDAAQRKLAGAAEQRARLLLIDDDAAVDALDREIERNHRTIEKVDLALPSLRERLLIARDKLRLERIAHHQRAVRSSAEKLEAVLLAAVEANEAADAAFVAAREELGEHAAFSLIGIVHYGGLVSRQGVLDWAVFQKQHTHPADRPRRVATPPAVGAPRVAAIAAPRPAIVPRQPPKARPPFVMPKPGQDGRIAMTVLRGGFTDSEQTTHGTGPVRLLPADAEALLRAGGGDIADDVTREVRQ